MLWKLSIITPAQATQRIGNLLAPLCDSLCSFEHDEQGNEWIIEGYLNEKPSLEQLSDITFKIQALKKTDNLSLSDLKIEEVEDRNWLEENLTQFPPLSVGKYFIYGSHLKDLASTDKIGIEINAATAFGSGEHETTSGCLLALTELQDKFPQAESFLDMGCGSGILAIAMAKAWDLPVIAVDNDPECKRVTDENGKINQCADKMEVFVSEGFQDFSKQISIKQFDIITANILAGPLRDMASDMVLHLAPKGYLILSGLLQDQMNWVVDAYNTAGAYLVDQKIINNWATLVLSKD